MSDIPTWREREVLTLLMLGYTDAEIAEKLFIGESTVDKHVQRLFGKYRARNRTQAVVIAYLLGDVGLIANPYSVDEDAMRVEIRQRRSGSRRRAG